MLIDALRGAGITVRKNVRIYYDDSAKHYTFADGTPFGIKKE